MLTVNVFDSTVLYFQKKKKKVEISWELGYILHGDKPHLMYVNSSFIFNIFKPSLLLNFCSLFSAKRPDKAKQDSLEGRLQVPSENPFLRAEGYCGWLAI